MLIGLYYYNNTTERVVFTGYLEEFVSASYQRCYNGIGQFKITIQKYDKLILELVQNSNIVEINGNWGVIESVSHSKGAKGYSLTISGKELKALAAKRIVIPPGGISHLYYSGAPEAVIAYLLTTEIINSGNDRRIYGAIASYDTSNVTMYYEGRYTNLASDIQAICETYDLGYYADVVNGVITWHIYRGLNRTDSQNVNEPFILSYDYGTLGDFKLDYSYQKTNMGYCGGQGEAEDRTIYEAGTQYKKWFRNEVFLDCRDCDTYEKLQERGKQKMAAYGDNVNLTATLAPVMMERYKVYFDLGDTGTIQDELLDVTDFCLVSITEVFESDLRRIDVSLGYDKQNLYSILREINNKANPILLA